jgi:hypothetical protein
MAINSHGNVDRIYALWQAIRYTEDFESQGAQTARLPRTPITDTAETTLRPFYHDSQKIWINSMVQRSGDNKPTQVNRTPSITNVLIDSLQLRHLQLLLPGN